MSDLVLDKNYKKGDKGKKIRLCQEWLCLHGFHIAIDGEFGPATDYAVRRFQEKNKMTINGIIDKHTFDALVKPMTTALNNIPEYKKSLSQMIAEYAEQHVEQNPREVGGKNCGPWVRFYMKGNEGQQWFWNAGFVSFILKQACQSLNAPLPITPSYSCDILAWSAKENNILRKSSQFQDKSRIPPGSFFLQRRISNDWRHTGIIIRAADDYFITIEANTNDEGPPEGHMVCHRIRGYNKKDLIIF